MVAIFTGLGAGFERGSRAALGGGGLLGAAAQGRGGENVFLNVANGNLMLTREDEFLVGRGLDVGAGLVYNSQGSSFSAHGWRRTQDRGAFNLTGTANTSGSTITRISGDGSNIVYTWNGTHYATTEGAGAHDRMTYDSYWDSWNWWDGDSGAYETYSNMLGISGRWQTYRTVDTDNNAVMYTYASGALNRVTTQDGSYIEYNWTSATALTIVTGYTDLTTSVSKTLTRTRQGFDGSGRLTSITTDLSPDDNSIADSNVYTTTITYHGATDLIATITQTDGSSVAVTYDGSDRVTQLVQSAASGDVRTTGIVYSSGYTEITDPRGQVTRLTFNGSGQLTQVTAPPAYSGATAQTVSYTYDGDGNVLTVTDAAGVTTYTYDSNGNVLTITDPNSNVVTRTYNSNNQVILETRTGSHEGGASASLHTRYVYDDERHLRFIVSASGRITEHYYSAQGELTATLEYLNSNIGTDSGTPSIWDAQWWHDNQADLTRVQRTDYVYDARGALTQAVTYAGVNSSAVGVTTEGAGRTYYTYDQSGRLLATHRGTQLAETFLYDGLGRLTQSVDLAGGTTTFAFNDASTTTTITTASGFTTVSTFNKVGELLSRVTSGAGVTGGTDSYLYDKNGQVRRFTDALGNKSYMLYDKAGRKIADIGHNGEMVEYRYDQANRIVSTTRYSQVRDSTQIALLDDPFAEVAIADVRPATDSAGDLWSWTTYDAGGRVVGTIEGDGSVTAYEYDNANRLVATKAYFNKLSGGTISGYKTTAPTSLSTPSAHAKDVVARTFYDRDGRVVAVLNGEGGFSRLIYDLAGRKIQEIAYAVPAPSALRASGTADAILAAILPSVDDVSTRYVYDGQGLLRFVIDGLGRVSENIYQQGTSDYATGLVRRVIQYAAPLGTVANYEYGTIKTAVAGLASSANDRTSYAVYNNRGQLAYAVDAMGGVTNFVYDSEGRVTRTTQFDVYVDMSAQGADHQWEANLDTWASTRLANARISRNYYNARGDLRFTLDAEGYATQNVYNAEGQLTEQRRYATKVSSPSTWDTNVSGLGSYVATQYAYDAFGRLLDTWDGAGVRRQLGYYATGQRKWEIEAYGQAEETKTKFEYDLAGRLLREIYAEGTSDSATIERVYDGLGNLTSITDPRSGVTSYTYDKAGRVLTRTDALSGVTSFAYDVFGRTVKSTDPRGSASFSYFDRLGRVIATIDAEGYITRTTYTAFGEVASVNRSDGRDASAFQSLWTAGGTGMAVAREIVDDQLVTTLRNDHGEIPGWSSYAWGGGAEIMNGERVDGFMSAQAGDQFSFSLQGRALDPGVTIEARFEFKLANGSSVYGGGMMLTSETWANMQGSMTAPAGAVSARLAINGLRYDANVNGGFDLAIKDLKVVRNGVTFDGETPDAGLARLNKPTFVKNWSAGGQGITTTQEMLDGAMATVGRNDHGEIPGWSSSAWGGGIEIMNGDRTDGFISARPGDLLAFSFDGKSLDAGVTLQARFEFKLANGSSSYLAGVEISNTSWTTFANSVAAPENTVAVHLGIFAYRLDSNINGGFDFAFRDLKITLNGVEKPADMQLESKGATTRFEYDKLGRLTKSVDAEGGYEEFTLNAFGQRTTVRNKLGGITNHTYDKRGLLIEERLPILSFNSDGVAQTSSVTGLQQVTHRFEYDARGNRTKLIEAVGHPEQRTTTYAYDAADRLISKTGDALPVAASATSATATATPVEYFYYDRRGNLIEQRDALGARTLSWYDKLNRVTHSLSPTGTLTRNFYDANGNLTETRVYAAPESLPANAEGAPPAGTGGYRVTQFTYDALNRLLTKKVPNIETATFNGGLSVTAQDIVTTYQYDANGNVVLVTDPNTRKTYSYYDKLGRKTVEIDAELYRTDWTYDSDGNVTLERRYNERSSAPAAPPAAAPSGQATHAKDRITLFRYDDVGRRLSETRLGVDVHNGSGAHILRDASILYQYNALGQVTRKTEATGDYIRHWYDDGGRMIVEQRSAFVEVGGTSIEPTVHYFYTGLNDLSRVHKLGYGAADDITTRYAYGAGGRLLSVADAEEFVRTYRYDLAGRIAREEYTRTTPTGSVSEAIGYDYDLEGRVLQQGIMTAAGGGAYTRAGADTAMMHYNAFGEVYERGLNGLYVEYFDYDGAGRLWRTTVGDGTWKYFMYDAAGNQTVAIASAGMDISNKNLAWVLDRWGANRAALWTTYVAGITATITSYDGRNQAIAVREPERELSSTTRANLVTTREYNAFGEIAYEINANNGRVDYYYNTMGRQIRIESPAVDITVEAGGVDHNYVPIEHRYYDVSGRLVASRDANGNLTRMTLLAGTGYGGSEALATTVTTADDAVVTTKYDVHGNAREIIDQIGRVTTQDFDLLGRVTALSAPGGLIDNYEYDGLGQRIKRWNNLLGSGVAETMLYDAQGRLLSHVAMGGDTTTTSYAWDPNLVTTGMGTFGGWTKTTTFDASTKTSLAGAAMTLVEKTDVFGNAVQKIDSGGVTANYTYDTAGRLTREQGAAALNYSYYNTGAVASTYTDAVYPTDVTEKAMAYFLYNHAKYWDANISWANSDYDSDGDIDFFDFAYWGGTPPASVSVQLKSTLSYDAAGNLLTQKYVEVGSGTVFSDATATYDALGRLLTLTHAEAWGSPVAYVSYEYDANGNIRRSVSNHAKLDPLGRAPTTGAEDYWYRYDTLNRVVTQKGQILNNVISRGATGVDLAYDAAGQRAISLIAFQSSGSTLTRREDYAYDNAGRVTQITSVDGTVAAPVPSGAGNLRSVFVYDLMGRMTSQSDYAADGVTAVFSHDVTYNAKSQTTHETSVTLYSSGATLFKTETDYEYVDANNINYAEGAPLKVTSLNLEQASGSSFVQKSKSITTNTYAWRDGPLAASTNYKYWDSVVGGVVVTTGTPTNNYSNFLHYSDIGDHAVLSSVRIQDGRPRTVVFRNDLNGQVIVRDEFDRSTNGDPHEIWYRFGGQERGYIGNNGTYDVDDKTSITMRTTSAGAGAFLLGHTEGGAGVSTKFQSDFDQSLDPISSFGRGSTPSSHVVRAGESLSSIAASLWGDSSLWYKLAEANGLSGGTMLGEGQTLRIPAGVMSSAHNASSFTPYDPSEAVANISPAAPKPPKKKGCGGFGQVLLAVIAIVVTAVVTIYGGPAIGAKVAGVWGKVLTGVVAGAAGSAASQTVGVATGIQDKFSWNAVAMAAIGGGVTGGIGLQSYSGWGQAAANAAARSIITQGIGVATGLQEKFSWAGVAASAVGAGLGQALPQGGGAAGAIGRATAYTLANAATRTLIEGTDFGDNIIAALPDVIGQTIGEAIAGGISGGRRSFSVNAKPIDELAPVKLTPLAEIDPMVNLRMVEDGESFSTMAGGDVERTLQFMEANAGIDPRRMSSGIFVNVPAADLVVSDATRARYAQSDGEYRQYLAAQSAKPVPGRLGGLNLGLTSLTSDPTFNQAFQFQARVNSNPVANWLWNEALRHDAVVLGLRANDLPLETPMLDPVNVAMYADLPAAGWSLLRAGGRAAVERASLGGGTAVLSGVGSDIRPMSIVRTIERGERLADIINAGKGLTFETGLEHALVRLSSGERAIVSGGADGIRFSEGQITRLFGHTHPTLAPPSRADGVAVWYYGQQRQHVFDIYGNVSRVRPINPNK